MSFYDPPEDGEPEACHEDDMTYPWQEPDFEAIMQNKHDRQEDDFNARWPK